MTPGPSTNHTIYYMYVCMYVYVYIYVCKYVCMYVCIYIYTHVIHIEEDDARSLLTARRMEAWACFQDSVLKQSYIYIYIYIYILVMYYIYIYIYIHITSTITMIIIIIYIYIYTHISIRIHMQTYNRRRTANNTKHLNSMTVSVIMSIAHNCSIIKHQLSGGITCLTLLV